MILIMILLIGGFFGWRIWGNKSQQPEYQTSTVERGMLISTVSASGQVLSVNLMSANTKTSGIVSQVYVKDGDQVNKGDKILEIGLDFQGEQKYAQAWSAYLSAKNGLDSAKATEYSLNSTMWTANQKFINDAVMRDLAVTDPTYIEQSSDWLAAEFKYKNQQSVVAQAQAALNNAWLSYKLASPLITAPTDGTLTSLMYKQGMNIGSLDTGISESNQKVATIRTEGTPIISVNLSEIDVSRVANDQKATITLDSIADKTFTGQVVGVDRIGQTTSGVTQYPAIIQLDSSAPEILPNMSATANIVINRKDNVIMVPSGAVKNEDGQNYVQLMVNNQPQFTPVETGLSSDSQTEIMSGIQEGDMVVTGTTASTASQSNVRSPFGSSGFGGAVRIAR